MPGRLISPAARRPPTIIAPVTALGVTGVCSSARVRYGESRRMYRRPAQCSPLLRLKISAGCPTAFISAIVGVCVLVDVMPDLLLAEVEVLQDGVAVGACGGRMRNR